MDFGELKKMMIHDFFYIYAGSIFGTYLFCSVFYPDAVFALSYFRWMAIFSLAGDATLLVFYSKKVLTERQFLMRTIIHFILLETVLMIFAGVLKLYESVLEAAAFFFVVLLVYIMVKFLSFKNGSKEAEAINRRIQEINERGEGL